ncbi:MAG TPA: hypothetical protein VGW34_14640 [Allosphingosinicella sp.]|nr:hypothetical protein [Allosphingosinicella sp.]
MNTIVEPLSVYVDSGDTGSPDLERRAVVPTCDAMNLREKWRALGRIPAVRTGLFVLGLLLMLASPLVGLFPGPGGVLVFGAGLALALKYSDWAKRQYVQFKRKHPNKGRWADWGLRRKSAKRREALRKDQQATLEALDD